MRDAAPAVTLRAGMHPTLVLAGLRPAQSNNISRGVHAHPPRDRLRFVPGVKRGDVAEDLDSTPEDSRAGKLEESEEVRGSVFIASRNPA